MKLSTLKEQLKKKNINRYSSIRRNVESTKEVKDIDEIKIIGITGSRGKSTTCYLVHEYLKRQGYKSILYSSVSIDSPTSYLKTEEACEIPLSSEQTLLNIIEEAENQASDFVVLEVNERAIASGITDEIPFSVKVLTNIIPKTNVEQYQDESYVALKQSFIKETSGSISIVGMSGCFTKEEFEQLNNQSTITFGSKYVCTLRGYDSSNIDYLLCPHSTQPLSSINGLNMKVKTKEASFDLNSKMVLPHNALNITCAISVLDSLGVFDAESFKDFINDIIVPGREEVIKVLGRTIIIGTSLMPALEVFNDYKKQKQIETIKVVCGAVGESFIGWGAPYKAKRRLDALEGIRRDAMSYVKKYTDYVYITSNDNGSSDKMMLALLLKQYLNDDALVCIEVDRKKAIVQAIEESKPGDLIYIAGRGNRKVFCDSYETMSIFSDKEIVLEAIKKLR